MARGDTTTAVLARVAGAWVAGCVFSLSVTGIVVSKLWSNAEAQASATVQRVDKLEDTYAELDKLGAVRSEQIAHILQAVDKTNLSLERLERKFDQAVRDTR